MIRLTVKIEFGPEATHDSRIQTSRVFANHLDVCITAEFDTIIVKSAELIDIESSLLKLKNFVNESGCDFIKSFAYTISYFQSKAPNFGYKVLKKGVFINWH